MKIILTSSQGKLDELFKNSFWTTKSNAELYVNLSSHELTKNESLVLGFGVNFSIAMPTLNPISIAESFIRLERNLNDSCGVSPNELLLAKGCVYGFIQKRFTCNIPERFIKALRDLKHNDTIHMTKADKANSIVILDSETYKQKLCQLLNDETTYSKLTSDPTERVNKNFNTKLKSLLRDCPNLKKSFLIVNPSLPYMYGLVKTHKPDNPLRPIISSVGSVTYKLSKWLANKLSPLVGTISPSHIKNSVDLVTKLKCHIGSFKLISFDVNSLFTKVPVMDVINFLRDEIEKIDLPVSADIFIKLLELCVLDNSFKVDGCFYKQTFGFAMGNPLSPILSNIYMEYFETRILPTICNFNIIWYRYVDDIICLWPKDKDPLVFLHSLNQLVPTIKFKIEIENDNTLPFLDTLIFNSPNQLKFDVYRKPTSVESFVHYFSNHDISVKRSIFNSMFLRALRICDPEFFDGEIKKIYAIGKNLCYPAYFIDACFSKTKKRFYENGERIQLQFNNVLTLPFRNELKPLTKILKQLNINVVFKYESTIRNLIIKNSPVEERNCGVYYIPCKGCDLVYVGQTGKSYLDREKQHKYNIRTANESSALFKHQQLYNHNINWNEGKIIFKSERQIERLITETCIIRKVSTMNLNEGFYKLDSIMINSLQSHPRIKRAISMCETG